MTASLIGTRRGAVVAAVLALLGVLLPFFIYSIEAIDIVCFALFAVAFDLLLGFTGLLSFGHALFWGGSAYVASLLLTKVGAPFPIAVLVAVLYAMVLALAVGVIAIKRTGIYFAMITLAIAQIQFFFAFQLSGLTGGENGLQLGARGSLFGLPLDNDRVYYYLALAIVMAAVYLVVRVVRSPFGAVLAATRENEQRAIGLGYRVDRYKLATFVLSGSIAGLAGALYAIGNHLAGLDGVDWHTSGKVVMMSILGGIGTVFGPIVGAGVFETLEYYVSKTPIGDKTNIVLGTIFAVVILVARRGIVGEILARRRGRAEEPS